MPKSNLELPDVSVTILTAGHDEVLGWCPVDGSDTLAVLLEGVLHLGGGSHVHDLDGVVVGRHSDHYVTSVKFKWAAY